MKCDVTLSLSKWKMQDDTKVQKVPFILFIKTKIIWSWSLSIWECRSTEMPQANSLANLQHVTRELSFLCIDISFISSLVNCWNMFFTWHDVCPSACCNEKIKLYFVSRSYDVANLGGVPDDQHLVPRVVIEVTALRPDGCVKLSRNLN